MRGLEPFIFIYLTSIVFLFTYSPSVHAAVTCKCEDKAKIECFSTFQECSNSCGGKAALARADNHCVQGWLPSVTVQGTKLKAGISINRIGQPSSRHNPDCSISSCGKFCVFPPTSFMFVGQPLLFMSQSRERGYACVETMKGCTVNGECAIGWSSTADVTVESKKMCVTFRNWSHVLYRCGHLEVDLEVEN
jgi:hypothetical protein